MGSSVDAMVYRYVQGKLPRPSTYAVLNPDFFLRPAFCLSPRCRIAEKVGWRSVW